MKGGFKKVTIGQLMRHESGMPFATLVALAQDRTAGLAQGWDTSLDPMKRNAILKGYFTL